VTLRSLRLRLLAGAALAILVSLVVAWFAMTLLFARHLERREIEELDRLSLPLIAGLRLDEKGAPVAEQLPTDPRFSRPSSGLYWQVVTASGTIRSRSLWDQELPSAKDETTRSWHNRIVEGPFEPQLLLLERHLRLAGDHEVTIQFAVDGASAGRARAEFGQELFLFLAGLWLVLSAAAAVQVQLGLQPLAKLREALKALRLNPSERLAVQDHPPEVEPLTQAINQLAETREGDLARARRRAADLAHGLKTPLAVLKAQSRHVREIGGDAVADNLDKAVAAAAAAVEAELARARAAAARESSGPVSAPVREVAERVVSVVERTEAGAALVFEIESLPGLTLPGNAEELSEILGALVENAARYARRRVRIMATADSASACLVVEDDGQGLKDWQAEEALIRGRRLDETGPGHGLGLAIARDLVEARGGTIALKPSELGGLKVKMIWPRA